MIGHYKLLEQIGAGGLGDVYRARDTKLGRTVAVKFPKPDLTADPTRRAELLRQAREVARLSHPSIATLFDVGEDGDRLYLVFEYVPGELLSRVIGGHPLNPRRAIEFGVQLADALAEAHAENLVHGDLRSQTIIVTPKDRAKLLDFGMAAFTRGGAVRGGRAGDTGSDIFALGCILFEMLTGRQALPAEAGQPAPPPSTITRGVPAELDPIVTRALAPDPGARYQSAATLSAELRGVAAILDIRTAAQEAEFIDEAPSRAGRGIFWLVALLVLGGAIAGLWSWREQAQFLRRRWFGPPPAPVLVVVPFEVGGTMPTITADGVAEDVMSRLGTISGLKVVGRSSLRSQRGRDPRTIARAAGAAVALVGTIRGTDDDIAMDTTLVDAATGATLWTRSWSSAKPGILAAEATLAEEIARALGLALPKGAAKARAASRLVNASAYDFYVRGRDAEARDNLTAAGDLYEQAVTLDGSLAEAYAALAAVSYRDLIRSARFDDGEAWGRIRRFAENAMTADPDLPAAQLAAALAAPTLRDALPFFRRGIELDPSRGEFYSEFADQIGEFDPLRAAGLYRTALALDADRGDSLAGLAELNINLDRMPEADAQIARGRQLYPALPLWDRVQAYGDLTRGQSAAAIAAVQDPQRRAADPIAGLLYLRALAAAGRVREADDEAAGLLQHHPSSCEVRAIRAGLLVDNGKGQEARQETDRIFSSASAADAAPGRIGCAAVAAAALGEADAAGRWLQRIAAEEPVLRMWALQPSGRALVREWYPWSKVAMSPAVISGQEAVQAAYARLRDEVARIFPTPEESQPASR